MNTELKLKDFDRKELILALNTAQHIFNLDSELYFSTETKDKEGICLVSVGELSNLFYKKMVGLDRKTFLKGFGTPSGNFFLNSDYCVAWYHSKESMSKKGILGPTDSNGYTHYNYIPDCIEDVITSRKLSSDEKLRLLEIMMLDLLKLRSIHEYAKKVLA